MDRVERKIYSRKSYLSMNASAKLCDLFNSSLLHYFPGLDLLGFSDFFSFDFAMILPLKALSLLMSWASA